MNRDYVAELMRRSSAHGERKKEQQAEADRLQREALDDAAAYMAAMEVTEAGDAA